MPAAAGATQLLNIVNITKVRRGNNNEPSYRFERCLVM